MIRTLKAYKVKKNKNEWAGVVKLPKGYSHVEIKLNGKKLFVLADACEEEEREKYKIFSFGEGDKLPDDMENCLFLGYVEVAYEVYTTKSGKFMINPEIRQFWIEKVS